MLSILLPVFNYSIVDLVRELHRQGQKALIPFEIICFDDGSKEEFLQANRGIESLAFVTYRELPDNLGRSRIRNALGQAAQYEYLLFMDCDAKVLHEDFLQRYLDQLKQGQLLYGGHVYQVEPPSLEYYFHWYYGSNRESQAVLQRKKHPHESFSTFNFIVPRSIFLRFLFNEQLVQYGHEDTLFGLALRKAEIPILHLDNPLEHTGLNTTAVFLEKTRQGVDNLHFLLQQGKGIQTKLTRVFHFCKKYRLLFLIAFIFTLTKPLIVRNFHSRRPNLKLFDWYKLGHLIHLENNIPKSK